MALQYYLIFILEFIELLELIMVSLIKFIIFFFLYAYVKEKLSVRDLLARQIDGFSRGNKCYVYSLSTEIKLTFGCR